MLLVLFNFPSGEYCTMGRVSSERVIVFLKMLLCWLKSSETKKMCDTYCSQISARRASGTPVDVCIRLWGFRFPVKSCGFGTPQVPGFLMVLTPATSSQGSLLWL